MSLGATLSHKVGPMPMGAWLLVGAGGLYIAYRRQNATPAAPAPAPSSDVPTPQQNNDGSITTQDGAPWPIDLPPGYGIPTPPPPVTVPTGHTPPPPRVPSPVPHRPPIVHPGPKPKPVTVPATYTVKSGDNLSSIAARFHLVGGEPALYARNKGTIETAAKRHGHPNSNSGNLIFPGTTLRLR